jgi:hypothetical protein
LRRKIIEVPGIHCANIYRGMCLLICMRHFSVIFQTLLQEWILRLKDTHPTNQIRLVEWTIENIACLERVNNKFMCAVDFWLDNIVAGFITEFVVDT